MQLKLTLKKLFKRIFTKKTLLIYIVILIVAIFIQNNYQADDAINVKSGKLTNTTPFETIVNSKNETIVDDGGNSIYALNQKGKLLYRIGPATNVQYTGITLDSDDNLYCYRSLGSNGGAKILKDEICKYDRNGKFIKVLYTIDYANEKKDKTRTARTSLITVDDNYLCFARFSTYDTSLIKVDIKSGKAVQMATLKADIPFLYNSIKVYADGHYYYAKITGEVGKGYLNQKQQQLYQENYDAKTGKGIRPFYVNCIDDTVYVYDYWTGYIYAIYDGKQIELSERYAYFKDNLNYDMMVVNNKLCGISDAGAWYIKDHQIHQLNSTASLSDIKIFQEKTIRLLLEISNPLIWIMSILIFINVFWLFGISSKRIRTKLVFYALCINVVLASGIYTAFKNEYNEYLKDFDTHRNTQAALSAEFISDNDLNKLTNSQNINTQDYSRIANKILKHYSVYESESDTAAMLLIKDAADDSYLILVSNRGYQDILGSTDSYNKVFAKVDKKMSAASYHDGTSVFNCAPIIKDNKIVAYFLLTTTYHNFYSQFLALWSLPQIILYFSLMWVLIVVVTNFVERKLKRVQNGIEKINSGDFTTRIKIESNDEIGELSDCVNRLSSNIENLLLEQTKLNEQLVKSQREVLVSLASIVEMKSGQTAKHVKRVGLLVHLIGEKVGYEKKDLEFVSLASMLHDVGKLFVPSEILEKPGKLTPEEFEVIKHHTVDGEHLLHNSPGEVMRLARIIALQHHEKWDGSGYGGLKGNDIDLAAQITALADVFDALSCERCYKPAFPPEKVKAIINAEAGKQFSPYLVQIFNDNFDAMYQIIKDNAD